MSEAYSDLDRLVLERWDDIRGLIKAQKDVQSRMDEVVERIGERVKRWALSQGFEAEASVVLGELHAWRPEWAEKRKGPRVLLVVGGYWPNGYRKLDAPYPYIGVCTEPLGNFRVKEPQRRAFGLELRASCDGQSAAWEEDADDANFPLSRYLKDYGSARRGELIGDPNRLFEFAKEQFSVLFDLSDAVTSRLGALVR